MSKLSFKAWIKRDILNNGGVDNFVKCSGDGIIQYVGADEIMEYISNNIVEIREYKSNDYDWIITNVDTGEKILIGVV